MEDQRTSYIQAVFEKYSDSGLLYYVSVKAENRAGLFSNVLVSYSIIILGENVPGVIDDGRQKFSDLDKSRDLSSIAFSFQGFESESCNIIGYQFAVGSEPYFSDVSPFSEFGIAHNGTHGCAERHIDLDENNTYYATVRAETGHNCHESYIVSSSDGITIDSTAPRVLSISALAATKPEDNENFYQYNVDSLDLMWNVDDSTENVVVNYSVGHLPFVDDILPSSVSEGNRIPPGVVSLVPGESVFLNIFATDSIGNTFTESFGQYTADNSKPLASNFSCSEMISAKLRLVNCSWVISEFESSMKTQTIAVGSVAMSDDIVPEKNISVTASSCNIHLDGVSNISVFVTLKMINVVDSEDSFTFEVNVDITDPVVKSVEIVTWTNPDEEENNKLCQMAWSYVDVRLIGVADPESGILR